MSHTLGGFPNHVNHLGRALRSKYAIIQYLIHHPPLLNRESFAVLERPQASKTVAEHQHDSAQMQQVDVIYRCFQWYVTISAQLDESCVRW